MVVCLRHSSWYASKPVSIEHFKLIGEDATSANWLRHHIKQVPHDYTRGWAIRRWSSAMTRALVGSMAIWPADATIIPRLFKSQTLQTFRSRNSPAVAIAWFLTDRRWGQRGALAPSPIIAATGHNVLHLADRGRSRRQYGGFIINSDDRKGCLAATIPGNEPATSDDDFMPQLQLLSHAGTYNKACETTFQKAPKGRISCFCHPADFISSIMKQLVSIFLWIN